MACRIQNTGRHPLRLDLRGGRSLDLRPGHVSPPLPDEALSGNNDLRRLVREGLVRRIDVQEPPAGGELQRQEAVGKEHISALTAVKGIGRVTAAKLVEGGVTDLSKLAKMRAGGLVKRTSLSKAAAEKILKAVRTHLRQSPSFQKG